MTLTKEAETDIALALDELRALLKAAFILQAAEIKVIRRHLMWNEYLRLAAEKDGK